MVFVEIIYLNTVKPGTRDHPWENIFYGEVFFASRFKYIKI